jgi:hypothetical protein
MEDIERSDNMSTIELPEGKVNILGGVHGTAQEFPEGCENFVKKSDLIFLEATTDYISDPGGLIVIAENSEQYHELIKILKQEGKAFYCPDLDAQPLHGILELDFDLIAPALEAILAGLLILRPAAKKPEENSTVDVQVDQGRRKILKILASSWLAMPVIFGGSASIAYINGAKSIGSKLASISDKLHPELYNFILNVRNLVFVYKLLYRLRNIGVSKHGGEKFVASIIVGFGHVDGIEEILTKYKNGEITFEQIEKAFLELKKEFGSRINNFSTIGAFWFDNKSHQWHRHLFKI